VFVLLSVAAAAAETTLTTFEPPGHTMQYAKLSFLALAMASLFACASAFVAPPSVARGCTHSTTELAVVRRLWRRLRGRNTGSYRDNELSEDGLTPIMEGVKSFGMAFRVRTKCSRIVALAPLQNAARPSRKKTPRSLLAPSDRWRTGSVASTRRSVRCPLSSSATPT